MLTKAWWEDAVTCERNGDHALIDDRPSGGMKLLTQGDARPVLANAVKDAVGHDEYLGLKLHADTALVEADAASRRARTAAPGSDVPYTALPATKAVAPARAHS